MHTRSMLFIILSFLIVTTTALADDPAKVKTRTIEIPFQSHDGHAMFGKLVVPETGGPFGVVIAVQTAEGATVDMKRRKGREGTFNYYDLYREKLPAMNVAFFSYEGRGIGMGDQPPRFEKIDWDVYNTSTLENKVLDALSALQVVQQQQGVDTKRIFLMGASESTLLAAQVAARAPKEVAGLVLYGVLTSNMRENFRYIMSEGAFLPYQRQFDTDKDGKISKQEYEDRLKKLGVDLAKAAPFATLDKNGDGFFTVDDMKIMTKKYLDAIDQDDFAVLQAWAKTSAAVSVPKDWFKDHFAQKPIWTYLEQVDIPVGCFHGGMDTNTPIGGVKKLEEQAKAAGKTKMKFFYFDKLDHSLNVGEYFVQNKLPEGHQAIFGYIKEQLGR